MPALGCSSSTGRTKSELQHLYAGDLLKANVMPSDHTKDALTWYTLSAATALLALRVLRNPGIKPP